MNDGDYAKMISLPVSSAHRLLSPRVGYLIGSGGKNAANIIPVSNVTSISTSPEILGAGIYQDWTMVETLKGSKGFALSVPTIEQLEVVWKLGAAYSHYKGDGSGGKMQEFEHLFDSDWSRFGPVLLDCIGRLECEVTRVVDDFGDHVWFLGSVTKAEADGSLFTQDGLPKADFHPVMQVVGNWMTTAASFKQIDFFE